MRKITTTLIGIILLMGCTGRLVGLDSNEQCAKNFSFSKDIEFNYGQWKYRNLTGTSLEACLPYQQYRKNTKNEPLNESRNDVEFLTGYTRVTLPRPSSDVWSRIWLSGEKVNDIPHIDVILREVKKSTDSPLSQWVLDNYSLAKSDNIQRDLAQFCEFSLPDFVSFEIPATNIVPNENLEFTKFQVCEKRSASYAIRYNSTIYIIRQDIGYKLEEGMNEELLINIIKSMRPVQ